MFFAKKNRGRVWKDFVKNYVIEDNDLSHNVEADAIESPIDSKSGVV